jgi:tRNA modification GTPase
LTQAVDIRVLERKFGANICRVSALDKTGFDALSDLIRDMFNISGIPFCGETVTNPRHAHSLRRAAEMCVSARKALASGLTPDLAAADIEDAINELNELTGKSASEEVIRRIFERFCVGK